MNPPQLSVKQIADLAIAVKTNRLSRVPTDFKKAQLFLDLAFEAVTELPNISANSLRYDTAYNIAHNVGEALLAAYGFCMCDRSNLAQWRTNHPSLTQVNYATRIERFERPIK